jgi:hypothetical protein
MPSKGTLSKLRVKQRKRTFLSKNAKRKTRAVKSLRKKRKSMKKLMMGGNLGYGSKFQDQGWSSSTSSSGPKIKDGFAIILYDDIGITRNEQYKVPICIFFMKYNSVTKDDIYIFFNKNVTDVEITDTVKAFLSSSSGIDENSINIDKPITKSPGVLEHNHNDGNLWSFISDTFVKIKGPLGNGTYGLESGTITNGGLLEIQTTKHTMTPDIPAINREKVQEIINGEKFVNKIKVKVQPELYKEYVRIINNHYRTSEASVDQKDYKKKMENRSLDKARCNVMYAEKHNALQIMYQIEVGANNSSVAFNYDVITIDDDPGE